MSDCHLWLWQTSLFQSEAHTEEYEKAVFEKTPQGVLALPAGPG